MSRPWPSLEHISFHGDILSSSNYEVATLSDGAFRALLSLIEASAAGLVWTYSAPGDGALPDDDGQLARLCRIGKRRWKKLRPEVEKFFKITGGKWRLAKDWIVINDQSVRGSIAASVQDRVAAREGRICTYCGDASGPFEFDHILPVARGGGNEPSNLTLACQTCNRSKGARTLREWMAAR